MDILEFYQKVEENPDMRGVGFHKEENEYVAVVYSGKVKGSSLHIPFSTITNTPWETMEEIILGQREPSVLHHMTRVVGYFSRVENWNASKLGELKDRQKGDYSI